MRLKKWNQTWKIRLIQEKPPHVDLCDAQWIPAYAGMTQYYHGERAQQPWIPAYAGLPRHSREGGNPSNTTQAS